MKEKTKGEDKMCRNGDIFMAKLEEDVDGGSIQAGLRPVLIVSNDKANQFSPVITIVPITSKIIGKKKIPTHVLLTNCGLPQQSIALVEQITSINKCRLIRYMTTIKKSQFESQIKRAIEIQLNL